MMDSVRSIDIVHLSRIRKIPCRGTESAAEPPTQALAAPRALGSRRSDAKAFSAAALALDVRIPELERLVQSLLDEIHLGAVDERQALAVDDDLDVPVVEDDVVRVDLVRVVEVIGPPGAAGALDADSQTDAVSALLQVALHSPNGVLRQRYRHG